MLHIHKLTIPDDHHDVHWQNYCHLGDLQARECIGGSEWDSSPEDKLAGIHRWQGECRFHHWVAYLDDQPVGTAYAFINSHVDATAGHLAVNVVPERRQTDIGTALAGELREFARSEGLRHIRTSLLAPSPTKSTEHLISPSAGIGTVPGGHPGVRFALGHGFALEQVERHSRYEFASPFVDLRQVIEDARTFAGSDYEVVTWTGATPEEFLPDLTVLRKHLISDDPSGGLSAVDDTWDKTRMRDGEKEDLLTEEHWTAAAKHRSSGHLVAASHLSRQRSKPDGFIEQKGTVVIPAHRGRRLGTLVKAANLLHVQEAVPNARAIMTTNAEENRWMLDINEALGFRPFLMEATFQRIL